MKMPEAMFLLYNANHTSPTDYGGKEPVHVINVPAVFIGAVFEKMIVEKTCWNIQHRVLDTGCGAIVLFGVPEELPQPSRIIHAS